MTYAVGPPCPGGNHFTTTLRLGEGRILTLSTDPDSLRMPLTDEEWTMFGVLYMRMLTCQLPVPTVTTITAALDATNRNMSLVLSG